MTNIRSALILVTFLLMGNMATLVASQTNKITAQPTSLFYERQMQVTTLSGQAPTITATATAALSALARSTEAARSYTGGSTSSVSTTHAQATQTGTNMSEEEKHKIAAYRAQQEKTLLDEEQAMTNKQEYQKTWSKAVLSPQQQVVKTQVTEITGLPQELANLVAQYGYEFEGKCEFILTDLGANRYNLFTVLPDNRLAVKFGDRPISILSTTAAMGRITLQGEAPTMRCCLTALSNDKLASGDVDAIIRIWDTATGKCLHTLKGHTKSIECLLELPNGNLASGSDDDSIKIWDPETGQCLHTLINLHPDDKYGGITCLEVLPNGKLASGTANETIKILNTATGQCLHTLRDVNPDGEYSAITCLKALPGSTLIAAVAGDNKIKIWDVVTGKLTQELIDQRVLSITCLAVLPGSKFASGSSFNTAIKIWDFATGTCITLTGHTDGVSCLTALPDGNLASGSFDKTIKIWDASTGTCKITMTEYTGQITGLAVLPNGRLVSKSTDGTIKIWS